MFRMHGTHIEYLLHNSWGRSLHYKIYPTRQGSRHSQDLSGKTAEDTPPTAGQAMKRRKQSNYKWKLICGCTP